jgi:hypothetical protein
MEVTLRRTKITASVLKQMEHATDVELFNFKTLGYVNIIVSGRTYKKALMTNENTCKLFTLPFAIEVRGRTVYSKYNYNGSGHKLTGNEIEAINLKEQMLAVKKQALELGQIFY